MCVLIADDCEEDRNLLKALLTAWGYEVQVVEDGCEAKERLLRPGGPRIAILDWMMPLLDGPSVCRAVREAVSERYPYLLLLTARNHLQDLRHGMEAGADDYLTKPFAADELYSRLRAGSRIVALDKNLRQANALLAREASHDSLTGLLNRGAASHAVEQEFARARRANAPVGVLVADIDHFKRINDTFGHAVGDEVLREIARRLKSAIRTYDHIGRWGGEEFIVVLPNCGAELLAERAEALRRVVHGTPIQSDHQSMVATISLGGCASSGSADPTPAIVEADEALYRAKRGGRNRVEIVRALGKA